MDNSSYFRLETLSNFFVIYLQKYLSLIDLSFTGDLNFGIRLPAWNLTSYIIH